MEPPEYIEGRKASCPWPDHLYTDASGTFSYDFKSSWETRTLEVEIARHDFVAWLRNEDRKDWSLTIPYQTFGEVRPFYPDLLVFRALNGDVAVDILDPHDPTRADWVPKVRGLAEYATRHWQQFGRMEAIIVEGADVRRLDLRVEANRNRARAAEGPQHLHSLFA